MNGIKRWHASFIMTVLFNTSAAMAELTANITLTSNYVTNGISQTGDKPALQVGFDYEHKSGLYVGTWASNVDPGYEADVYAGYTKATDNLGFDVGYTSFNYSDNNFDEDTSEIYIGCICKAGLIFYSVGKFQGFDYEYYELISEYETDSGVSIGLHYGLVKIDDLNTDYYDYDISVSKLYKGFKFAVTYSVGEFADDEISYLSMTKEFEL
ncbi:MAG: TorF family putative porin [Gammaproteobacteria bacterium]|nr:TorF family putative porin [Gammaproteobacteria bacterium]